uniref:Uncharacterized protein n=1 Tax=Chromera velia CCMP2878 TaxID=1169474 RepID=A0A0G4HS87_9ALVE|eukprot:Cvel_8231.t1-p1 / transcript=Cvel_8231.t1 / gene=Cvel_8231 / organism=Chromera_velia_CCMP2878 / gene_product=hypothetical protein / transcript_product=hypothetical protein / location=Cvel_scaffold449:69748-78563(-) / protein_length=1024 / sequence_SO=supercontig / SO=protein_coding / is_pseudo=false
MAGIEMPSRIYQRNNREKEKERDSRSREGTNFARENAVVITGGLGQVFTAAQGIVELIASISAEEEVLKASGPPTAVYNPLTMFGEDMHRPIRLKSDLVPLLKPGSSLQSHKETFTSRLRVKGVLMGPPPKHTPEPYRSFGVLFEGPIHAHGGLGSRGSAISGSGEGTIYVSFLRVPALWWQKMPEENQTDPLDIRFDSQSPFVNVKLDLSDSAGVKKGTSGRTVLTTARGCALKRPDPTEALHAVEWRMPQEVATELEAVRKKTMHDCCKGERGSNAELFESASKQQLAMAASVVESHEEKEKERVEETSDDDKENNPKRAEGSIIACLNIPLGPEGLSVEKMAQDDAHKRGGEAAGQTQVEDEKADGDSKQEEQEETEGKDGPKETSPVVAAQPSPAASPTVPNGVGVLPQDPLEGEEGKVAVSFSFSDGNTLRVPAFLRRYAGYRAPYPVNLRAGDFLGTSQRKDGLWSCSFKVLSLLGISAGDLPLAFRAFRAALSGEQAAKVSKLSPTKFVDVVFSLLVLGVCLQMDLKLYFDDTDERARGMKPFNKCLTTVGGLLGMAENEVMKIVMQVRKGTPARLRSRHASPLAPPSVGVVPESKLKFCPVLAALLHLRQNGALLKSGADCRSSSAMVFDGEGGSENLMHSDVGQVEFVGTMDTMRRLAETPSELLEGWKALIYRPDSKHVIIYREDPTEDHFFASGIVGDRNQLLREVAADERDPRQASFVALRKKVPGSKRNISLLVASELPQVDLEIWAMRREKEGGEVEVETGDWNPVGSSRFGEWPSFSDMMESKENSALEETPGGISPKAGGDTETGDTEARWSRRLALVDDFLRPHVISTEKEKAEESVNEHRKAEKEESGFSILRLGEEEEEKVASLIQLGSLSVDVYYENSGRQWDEVQARSAWVSHMLGGPSRLAVADAERGQTMGNMTVKRLPQIQHVTREARKERYLWKAPQLVRWTATLLEFLADTVPVGEVCELTHENLSAKVVLKKRDLLPPKVALQSAVAEEEEIVPLSN